MKLNIGLAPGFIIILSILAFGMLLSGYLINVDALHDALDKREMEKAANAGFIVNSLINEETKRISAISSSLKNNGYILEGIKRYERSGEIGPLSEIMDRLYNGLSVDILIATDSGGRIIHHSIKKEDRKLQRGYSYQAWGMAEALEGEDIMAISKTDFGWDLEAIASIGDESGIYGTIVVGSMINDAFATKIALDMDTQVTIGSIRGEVASSLPTEKRNSVNMDTIIRSLRERKTFSSHCMDDKVFSLYQPLMIIDETFCIVIQNDISKTLSIMRQKKSELIKTMTIASLAILVMGSILSMYMTRPLKRLMLKAGGIIKDISKKEFTFKGNELNAMVQAFDIMVDTVNNHIEERKKSEEKLKDHEKHLEHIAHHDPLTGLPNRRMFTERMTRLLERLHQDKNQAAVMLLDLDNFKIVNDTLGHSAGDILLCEVAERLRKCVRPWDVVARLGGDEFIILLPMQGSVESVLKIAKRVIAALEPTFMVDNHELYVTTSIGIAVFPNDGEDIDTLIRNADSALYYAKNQGKNNLQLFNPSMNAQAKKRMLLENALHKALERNEFLIHYQPLVDLQTGFVVGLEALLRWQHPEYGLISPADFIPVAEDSGLIIPIGEWVIKNVCKQIKIWRETNENPVRVAVNLSARQFRQKNLVDMVKESLEDSGLDGRWLEFEITESAIMHDMDESISIMNSLHSLGILISIDDFGTGYSSLSYLRRFPIYLIKIDRSFTKDIALAPDADAIIKAIISMAHNLNIKALAEGVETTEQLEFLRGFGCDLVQGYLISRPLDAEKAAQFLARGNISIYEQSKVNA